MERLDNTAWNPENISHIILSKLIYSHTYFLLWYFSSYIKYFLVAFNVKIGWKSLMSHFTCLFILWVFFLLCSILVSLPWHHSLYWHIRRSFRLRLSLHLFQVVDIYGNCKNPNHEDIRLQMRWSSWNHVGFLHWKSGLGV